jgi:nicotinamidase-related amidase
MTNAPLPLELDPATTALVLIDLQKGILPFAKAPYDAAAVLASAGKLVEAFRAAKAPIVFVKVGWSADGGDALKTPVDNVAHAGELPADWLEEPEQLRSQPGDLHVLKHQWGAFHGTDLDLQLRRRGIRTIVLGGIASAIGVESTGRFGWELGYAMVFVEDASSNGDGDMHVNTFTKVFPRIGRVRDTAQVVAALKRG